MKFANVKALWVKEAKKALRGTRKEGMTNIFAAATIGDSSMHANYLLYEAAHAVGMFNESVLVYAYVRGLMNKDMYVKYMPALKIIESDLYSKKATPLIILMARTPQAHWSRLLLPSTR